MKNIKIIWEASKTLFSSGPFRLAEFVTVSEKVTNFDYEVSTSFLFRGCKLVHEPEADHFFFFLLFFSVSSIKLIKVRRFLFFLILPRLCRIFGFFPRKENTSNFNHISFLRFILSLYTILNFSENRIKRDLEIFF